jgi:HD-GYP domain-containing protein (c-di-GMP phosphodiesterase class II)
MNKSIVALICVLLCVFGAGSIFAADEALVTRYLNAANEQYSAGNNEKAFSYINTVLGLYGQDALPPNVEVLAETVYYSYLDDLKESRNYRAFSLVKEKLISYPALSSERVSRMVKILNTYESQDTQWGADPSKPSAQAVSGTYSATELQLALETVRKEAASQTQEVNDSFRSELLATQKEAYESALRETKEATSTSNKVLIFSLIMLAALIFVVFLVVVLNLVVNLKNSKTQNERFVETLKVVSQIAQAPNRSIGIESLPSMYGASESMVMIGSADAATGLPSAPATEAEETELAELAKTCRDIGVKIDQATGRKNNSKNVAEMIFKIAQEQGIGQYESMLFFSVGMVYDIGFLEIDKTLLLADNLTEEQKMEIRNHVKQGLAQLSFVPDRYMQVFADGVLMHHENVDGSGYPEGLSGSRIPYIARVIRVAESFVALISKRSYRDIYDKESAVEELKKKPGLYDPDIVHSLENLI